MKRHHPEKKAAALQLAKAEKTPREIAEILGLHKGTVWAWINIDSDPELKRKQSLRRSERRRERAPRCIDCGGLTSGNPSEGKMPLRCGACQRIFLARPRFEQERIRGLEMLSRGARREDVAKELGVSVTTVGRWVRGR